MSTALMGKPEKIVAAEPPAPTATAVRAHKRTLMLELDALKLGAAALALSSARGAPRAQAELATLCSKITAVEFEIACNDRAVELARGQDAAAAEAWRAEIETLSAEEVILGIGKEVCCRRCIPGSFCVITSADPAAGGTCGHPIITKHLQHLDEAGRRLFAYRDTPRAAEIYAAACRKLKVPSS